MSIVRNDASSVVVAERAMGTGMAAPLVEPGHFVLIVGCLPEWSAGLDLAETIPAERIESSHMSAVFGFRDLFFRLWNFSAVDGTVRGINE